MSETESPKAEAEATPNAAPQQVKATPLATLTLQPAQPEQNSKTIEFEPQTEPATTPGAKYSWGFGLLVWIAILAGLGYFFFHKESGALLLNTTSTEPLTISGAVIYKGQTLQGGTVQITGIDATRHQYIGSEILSVNSEGRFRSDPQKPLITDISRRKQKLEIRALYMGQSASSDAKDRKPVTAEQTIYLNFTPLFGANAPWVIGAVCVIMIMLIFLFTGNLTKTKARALFMITYGVTLVSLVVPIALTIWMSRNPYLLDLMENAPIALLKGTGKGIESPQWILNIGGAIKPQEDREGTSETPAQADQTGASSSRAPSTSAPSSDLPSKPTAGQSAIVPASIPTSPPVTQAPTTPAPAAASAKIAPVESPATASSSVSPAAASAPIVASNGIPQVTGGLAIPLFVVLLATLGAGINMTRQVPEIQKNYDNVAITLASAIRAPSSVLSGSDKQIADASTIRKDLIQTYMYFISAPFLAIAVYYLLQIIATSVAEPVLVIIAFATGLMSNTVVGAIITFADATLKKVQKGQANATIENGGTDSKPDKH